MILQFRVLQHTKVRRKWSTTILLPLNNVKKQEFNSVEFYLSISCGSSAVGGNPSLFLGKYHHCFRDNPLFLVRKCPTFANEIKKQHVEPF